MISIHALQKQVQKILIEYSTDHRLTASHISNILYLCMSSLTIIIF